MSLAGRLRAWFAPESGWLGSLLAPLAAILGALAVGGLMILVSGYSPLASYQAIFRYAFGTRPGFGITLTYMIPLLLAGLGVALPFRGGLLNIGGEGQIYMGALAATVTALYIGPLPRVAHLPLCLLAAFLGGAAWGAVPGWLRARRGLNEIITTIMLNYIAFWIVSWLVHGPLIDPANYGYAWTLKIPASAELPTIWKAGRVHAGLVLAVLMAAAVYFVLWRTTLGYELRAVGVSASTARFGGLPVERSLVLSLALGGGLCGLAGASIILGEQFRLSDFFSPNYGFQAISVALVGRTTPLGVLFAALFFGGLLNGTASAQRTVGIPSGIALTIQGVTLLFVIASQSRTLVRWLNHWRTARHVEHS